MKKIPKEREVNTKGNREGGKLPPFFEVSEHDLDWLLLASLRYALDRLTYAPSLTAEIIMRRHKALSTERRRQMVNEIREHLRLNIDWYKDGYRDIPHTWEKLARDLEETL